MKISACLVVRNEEKLIEGCLESIKYSVNEILLAHDGPCADRTIEIARRYTKKIYVLPSVGNGNLLDPYLLKKAKGEWILKIDADERLSKGLQKKLCKLAEDGRVDAYSFSWPLFDEKGRQIEDKIGKTKTVFFRRSKMYRIGLPHIAAGTYGVTKKSPLVLEHHLKSREDKTNRFFVDVRKNTKRAKIMARKLTGPLTRILTYNCAMFDTSLKPVRKLMFERKFPFIAIFILPPYSFFQRYVLKGYFKAGYEGFQSSVNLPIFHFLTCFYIMKYAVTRKWKQ